MPSGYVDNKPKSNLRLLDLGTGTGCIAISCKLEEPSLEITAVDNYAATLQVAQDNALKLGATVNFVLSNWYENVTGKFDIIVSNPPYIEKNDPHLANLSYEPQQALTDFADGMRCYQTIIEAAYNYLANQGYLILEHGYNQQSQIIRLLNENNFKNIQMLKDYAGQDRIIVAQV